MRLLDFDYDEGKNIVTFEAKNSEIFAVCKFLESCMSQNEENEKIKELYHILLQVISVF